MSIHKNISQDKEALDIYLSEISETEPLCSEEEKKMAKRIREGDERAVNKMVQANLRFVVVVAKQYQNQGLSLSDLISEGNIGLIKAVRRFDESKGFKFISYAVWWIRQAILHALAEQVRLIRLPVNKLEEIRRIDRLRNKQKTGNRQKEFGQETTEGDENQKLTIPEWAHTPVSLDAPIGEGAFTLLDKLKDQNNKMPDEFLQEELLRIEVKRAVTTLNERESQILNLYFGLDMDRSYTLEEIGRQFGVSRERIRQIKQKAINKLRHSHKGHRLLAYAD